MKNKFNIFVEKAEMLSNIDRELTLDELIQQELGVQEFDEENDELANPARDAVALASIPKTKNSKLEAARMAGEKKIQDLTRKVNTPQRPGMGI